MLKDPKWERPAAPQKYPLRQAWLDALRSGKHRQVTGRFGDPHRGFCAMGLAQWIVATHLQPRDPMGFFLSGRGRIELEQALIEHIGFRDSGGGFRDYGHTLYDWGLSFISANDSHGRTFKEIADFAEANPDICFLRDNEKAVYDNTVDCFVIVTDNSPVTQQPMPYDEKCAQQAEYAAECLNKIDALADA